MARRRSSKKRGSKRRTMKKTIQMRQRVGFRK